MMSTQGTSGGRRTRPRVFLSPLSPPLPPRPQPALPPLPASPPEPTVVGAERSPALERALATREDAIKGRRTESAYIYGPDGTLRLSKAGTSKRVRFTEEEAAHFDGATLTHNHPGFTRTGPSSSFSKTDVRTAITRNLAEIRAVNLAYRHSLRPPLNENWAGKAYARFETAIDVIYTRTMHETRNEVLRGALTPDEAQAEFTHRVWTEVAARFGWRYERTPWSVDTLTTP